MLLAMRISSYGCTWEVWRALKKLELLSAVPRATLTLLSCSPNFPRASITRYTHAKHESILNFDTCYKCPGFYGDGGGRAEWGDEGLKHFKFGKELSSPSCKVKVR